MGRCGENIVYILHGIGEHKFTILRLKTLLPWTQRVM